jgi:hypothetical protein
MKAAFSYINKAINLAPRTYNFFYSKVELSDERRANIDKRRSQLKFESNDPLILKIIIEEMLAYKTSSFSLDDRYLQLEQVLDAIDKAKINKETDELLNLCVQLAKENASSPVKFKNAFLERLNAINSRIREIENNKVQSKL